MRTRIGSANLMLQRPTDALPSLNAMGFERPSVMDEVDEDKLVGNALRGEIADHVGEVAFVHSAFLRAGCDERHGRVGGALCKRRVAHIPLVAEIGGAA